MPTESLKELPKQPDCSISASTLSIRVASPAAALPAQQPQSEAHVPLLLTSVLTASPSRRASGAPPPVDGRRFPAELLSSASSRSAAAEGWSARLQASCSHPVEHGAPSIAAAAKAPRAQVPSGSLTGVPQQGQNSLLPPIDSPSLRRPPAQLDALSASSQRCGADAWAASAHPRSSSSAGQPPSPARPKPSSPSPAPAAGAPRTSQSSRDQRSAYRDGLLTTLDVPLGELPAVQHLAESTWTRALTGNIKAVAQAQGALGYAGSSQPASPHVSQLGTRSGVQVAVARRRSSAMGYGGGGGGGGGNAAAMTTQSDLLIMSSLTPQRPGAGQGVCSTLLTSLEGVETADDVEPPALPSVLPPALLSEAARAGVSLEVELQELDALDTAQPLGRGVSGTVFRAAYGGQPCAVKMLAPDMLFGSGSAELQTFVQEMVVLASVRHPNVVTFLGGSLQPPHVFMIEELCELSLEAWLYRDGAASRPMNSWQQLKVALDVATGLQHLHERVPAIVHRDLKPANILIDKDWNAKISDFGLARIKTQAVISTKAPSVGSIGYMAPECFTSEDGSLTDKCDTWSLGVVLYEMVTRKRPWAGLTLPEYYREVVIRKSRLQIPMDDNVCPMALRRLISSCWCDDPEERPSCAHVVAELTRLLKYCPRD